MRLAVQQGQSGFLPMVYEDNIEPAILNKFLFNSCLNALGALTGMTYGELLGNPSTRHLITHIADETIRLVQLERNLCLAASGVDYVENSLLPLVIPKGAAHRSSMFQDVEAGRRTEIDYLNGAAVRMGHARGIATPYNDVISNLIRARETGSRSG
jgi:2-dehydropantoate 2-reductase